MPGGKINGKQAASSAADVELHLSDARVVEVRLAHPEWTLKQIADEVGYANHSGVIKALIRARMRINESAVELRARDNAAIDELLDECLVTAFDRGNPAQFTAMATAIQLWSRRAKLMGLDAPQRKLLGVLDGETFAALISRMENELRAMGHDPATLQLAA